MKPSRKPARATDLDLLLRRCRNLQSARRRVLFCVGTPMDHLYFVDRGLVSCIKTIADGRSVKIGEVGTVKVKKRQVGEGKNIIAAAFGCHYDIKQVIVVDDDIDIDPPEEIE